MTVKSGCSVACRHLPRTRRVYLEEGGYLCAFCGTTVTPEQQRTGRTSRSRGNDIERTVCKLLGITRMGQYGGKEDGGKSDEWITVSVKSGGTYPERIDSLLRGLSPVAGQLAGVVHADTPGPGVKRRLIITLDLYDFADHYGAGS